MTANTQPINSSKASLWPSGNATGLVSGCGSLDAGSISKLLKTDLIMIFHDLADNSTKSFVPDYL